MISSLPAKVMIQEVGPRDGLQIEAKILSLSEKLELIESLMDAGLREIEVGSFVNPRAVPQMADSEDLIRLLPDRPDVNYRALWLNDKGLARAIRSGRIAVDGKLQITASNAFTLRNFKKTLDEAVTAMPEWISMYQAAGIKTWALGVQAAFGCNFEGDVRPADVVALISRVELLMNDSGNQLKHLRLADTMGWANPIQVKRLVGLVRERWPNLKIRLHLHDTRGLAIANAFAGMEMGVDEFDAAIGGLGGCPFAGNPGSAGNICTEDLVFLCNEIGVETGVDLDKLITSAELAERLVERPLPGKLAKSRGLQHMRH
jgi:hydroxymethylglutaryl-CoA lyase